MPRLLGSLREVAIGNCGAEDEQGSVNCEKDYAAPESASTRSHPLYHLPRRANRLEITWPRIRCCPECLPGIIHMRVVRGNADHRGGAIQMVLMESVFLSLLIGLIA